MPKLVCTNCNVELRPVENGVHVHEMCFHNTEIYKIWSADLWGCPLCPVQVVAGFAERPLAVRHEPEKLQAVLVRERDYHTTVIKDLEVQDLD